MTKFEVANQHVVIAGGSKGLGKALAIELARRGAHILLLARSIPALELAKEEVLRARRSEVQIIEYKSIDLCDHVAAKELITTYPHLPSTLICVAGGTPPSQIGFLADLDPTALTSCLSLNYTTSIFITQSLLQRWIANPLPTITRHIIFINSAACFVAIPSYIAYTTSKAALRAFADTLRVELLLYGSEKEYKVHSIFPGTFLTESFLKEQEGKSILTKKMEGSDYTDEELLRRTMGVEEMSRRVLRGLDRGEGNVTTDLETRLVLNNMRGPSPREGWGIWDTVLGLVGWVVWPWVRWGWDGMVREEGRGKGWRT